MDTFKAWIGILLSDKLLMSSHVVQVANILVEQEQRLFQELTVLTVLYDVQFECLATAMAYSESLAGQLKFERQGHFEIVLDSNHEEAEGVQGTLNPQLVSHLNLVFFG